MKFLGSFGLLLLVGCGRYADSSSLKTHPENSIEIEAMRYAFSQASKSSVGRFAREGVSWTCTLYDSIGNSAEAFEARFEFQLNSLGEESLLFENAADDNLGFSMFSDSTHGVTGAFGTRSDNKLRLYARLWGNSSAYVEVTGRRNIDSTYRLTPEGLLRQVPTEEAESVLSAAPYSVANSVSTVYVLAYGRCNIVKNSN